MGCLDPTLRLPVLLTVTVLFAAGALVLKASYPGKLRQNCPFGINETQ